jgi:hypothetical protein
LSPKQETEKIEATVLLEFVRSVKKNMKTLLLAAVNTARYQLGFETFSVWYSQGCTEI